MLKTLSRIIVAVCALFPVAAAQDPATRPASAPSIAPRDVTAIVEELREKNGVPALGAALIEGGRVTAIGVSGKRSKDADAKVAIDERWHLGSCTKAMTATLCAMLVDDGKLTWTTSIGEVFAKRDGGVPDAWKAVTLEQLLTNHGGVPSDLSRDGLWGKLWEFKGAPTEARIKLLDGVLAHPPESQPGTTFLYSNAGFSIAGAMCEAVTGTPYEELMQKRLFAPLGMSTAGFGAPGKRDELIAPLGHRANGDVQPFGPGDDNPEAITPAGRVHASLEDWSKFIALHLSGARGDEQKLVRSESMRKLHAAFLPESKNPYAMGWGVASRPWADGTVLTHNGSNTLWFCVAWIAPKKDFAVIATTNIGGDKGAKATDAAVGRLIHVRNERRK